MVGLLGQQEAGEDHGRDRQRRLLAQVARLCLMVAAELEQRHRNRQLEDLQL